MSGPDSFRLGSVRVDLGELRVHGPSGEQPLTPLEAKLLAFLVAHRGSTVGRETLLVEVWGYSPKALTRAVDNTVSRLRRKLEVDPAQPRWLVSTRGGGYRLEAEPQERSAVGNLPAPRDSFVGRQRELAAIGDALGEARLITLTGPGGTGKTRLACELARRQAPRFPGGTWLADLAAARDQDGVLQAVAAAVRVPLRQGDPVTQLVAALAYRGSMLLVLDNCDQVTDDAAQLVSMCLDQAPELVVLATSREPLRLRGEQRRPIGPLPLPEAPTPQAVEDSDAAVLFVQRTRAFDEAFAVTERNATDLARVIQLLDGLPLAIELAACRAGSSLGELAVDLQDRLDPVASDERDRPDRHRSLVAMLDWSWGRLDPDEQRALARLSVFEGGCAPEAAVALLAGTSAATILDALLDRSLLRRGEGPITGAERLTMLVTVRSWVRDKLPDDVREAEEAHGTLFARFGEEEALRELSQADRCAAARRTLAEELGNLEIACRRAIARGDPARAVPLLAATWAGLSLVGPVRRGLDLARALLEVPGLDPRSRAAVERIAGQAADRSGKFEDASGYYQAALSGARAEADRATEATALRNLGALHWRRGELALAEPCSRGARDLSRALGDRSAEAVALTDLALIHATGGDMASAEAEYEEALSLARAAGDRAAGMHTSCNFAILRAHQARLSDAVVLLEDALAAARELGDRWFEGMVTSNLGSLSWELGQSEEALVRLEEALRLHREVGDRRGEGGTEGVLGALHVACDRHEDAQPHLEVGLRIARELSDRVRIAQFVGRLAVVHAEKERRSEALSCFEEAEGELRAMCYWRDLSELMVLRTEAHQRWGEIAEARRALDEAHRAARDGGMGPETLLGQKLAELEQRQAARGGRRSS